MSDTTQAGYLVDGRRVDQAEARRLLAPAPLEERMRRCLALTEGPRVVDVGCYSGAFVAALSRENRDWDVIGVDSDPENIRIAHLLHPELAERLRLMSVYDLEFDDASLDCVTFQEVIEHLEGAASAIKEINRVLRPGGSLVLSTPSAYYWRHFAAFAYRSLRGRPIADTIYHAESAWNRHVYSWTPETLVTLLKVNGFELAAHEWSRQQEGRVESALLRAAPFLSPVMVMKARKVAEAPPELT